MKRLHSIERKAFQRAERKLWETKELHWRELRAYPAIRNQMIADEIRDLGYSVTWGWIGDVMVPEVYAI
jgi:hypothetical protein